MPESYATAFDIVSKALLVLAAIAGAICLLDWAIRTRRIGPFSWLARFFRRWVDPLLAPIERVIVRRGGLPQQAPFYAFMVVIVGGILLLYLLRFIVALLLQVRVGLSSPDRFFFMLLGWGFDFLTIALIVRVVSSWLPVSPYSKWIRWSYVSTEWFLSPLRRIIPPLGQIDLSPIVAYFLIQIVATLLHV